MRELPGFYWDQDKNRYFSLLSKPQASLQSTHKPSPNSSNESNATTGPSTSNHGSQRNLKRKRGISWNVAEGLRGSVYESQNRRYKHEMMCSHLASTSRLIRLPVPDPICSSITAFKSAADGGSRMFYGDTAGWLYSFNDTNGVYEHQREEEARYGVSGSWVPEINLTSEISSICVSDLRCVATSFGPIAKIMVQDLSTANTFILSPGNSFLHDVWTSHLQGRSLALGASKKAVFLKDIDVSRSLDVLGTQSDVFAVEQQENLVYAGARNGSIARFDMRVETNGQNLLDNHFMAQANSVTHLKIVRDWQLIVANMNGALGLYDLRFARGSTPLLDFAGHNNSYTSSLGLTVDLFEDFLFVAGQDRRIRGWSLQSGQALQPPTACSLSTTSSTLPSSSNPFCMEFSKPVAAMQVTSQQEGMCLWAASDKDLFKYHLGQWGN